MVVLAAVVGLAVVVVVVVVVRWLESSAAPLSDLVPLHRLEEVVQGRQSGGGPRCGLLGVKGQH